ncbi:MAG TPA: EAL domain-containing protein [Abditibacteriaceae bacterium]|jgi:EAL domain-containing protein (putative c-di-GMP-specific phosphodiesterase class I)
MSDNGSNHSCQRCEVVPQAPQGPGIIHLQFPLSHSRGKVIAALKHSGANFSEEKGALSIAVTQTELMPALQPLAEALSATERADVRVLFQREGQLLQLQDYFAVLPLDEFMAKAQSGWLVAMLSEDRLSSVFQPIIHCQSQEIFAYECLMRGQVEGKTVFPGQIIEVAKAAGLLFQMDLAARRAAITGAAQFGLQSKIFINFTPTAIYDPVNCLKSTVETVDAVGLRRDQVVFEVIESEQVSRVADLNKILDYYRQNGFQVALDDVGAGYSSLNLLARLRPDFIKLDRDLITDIHQEPVKATIAAKLLETARELGMKTVAEGIEQKEEYQWLCQHGADYAQGYLFARPASPPPIPIRQ